MASSCEPFLRVPRSEIRIDVRPFFFFQRIPTTTKTKPNDRPVVPTRSAMGGSTIKRRTKRSNNKINQAHKRRNKIVIRPLSLECRRRRRRSADAGNRPVGGVRTPPTLSRRDADPPAVAGSRARPTSVNDSTTCCLTQFYRGLLGSTEFHCALLGFTEFYWVAMRFTELYWFAMRFNEFYMVPMGYTEFH